MSHAPLNDVLDALLYRKRDREAFLAGDLARFDLSAADQAALKTIDPSQLESAARLARDHVLRRSHRGAGSLVQMFGQTVRAWQTERAEPDLDAMAESFVASRHFDAYRTHAFAGPGIGIEEAFFRFAEEEAIGHASVRFRECAVAVLRGLLATPRPTFLLPAFVRAAPRGHFVVAPEGPTLYAALNGRFVEGPITPYIASVLTETPDPNVPAPSAAEREAVRRELVQLGLLAAPDDAVQSVRAGDAPKSNATPSRKASENAPSQASGAPLKGTPAR